MREQGQKETSRQIAARAVRGSVYNAGTAVFTLSLGFVRAVLLARLLLPEHFGAAALALFFNGLANQLRALGMDSALIQRRDVGGEVLPTYFTLRMALLLGSVGILAAFTPALSWFYPDAPRLGPLVLAFAGISLLRGANAVQETLLTRQLAFARLAHANIAASVTTTVVAPLLAWHGWGVWSLVAEQLSGQLARAIVVWGLYRPWRPRWGWDADVARWFWRFGVRVWTGNNLNFVLLRFGDFWTGTALGHIPLGFYSRATQFAGYTGRAIAPLGSIFFPTFSRLQGDRLRLSQAFFRAISLVVRLDVGLAVILIVAAPEATALLLGERWLPMVTAFQLMVVFTMLDPVENGAGDLLLAAGQPGRIVRVRVVQCLLFVPAVVLLGSAWGIVGVAVAADIAMLTGVLLLLRETRRIVEYSPRRLWWWPAVAVAAAVVAARLSAPVSTGLPLWAVCAVKISVVGGVYAAVLWLTERAEIEMGWRLVWGLMRTREQPEELDGEKRF